VDNDAMLLALMQTIAAGDRSGASSLLQASPQLAVAALEEGASRQRATEFFLDAISHYVYEGDTALHVAAAAYDTSLVRELQAGRADVAATNRRGAQAIHYAVDGGPNSARWDPIAQRETVSCLIELGADPNATDKNGTPPLLRAVRNRCASAVAALLEGGAYPGATNKQGSTAKQLAEWTTGRGGSGSPAARAQQQEIIELLRTAGPA
jgi:ankyrin repeat protein